MENVVLSASEYSELNKKAQASNVLLNMLYAEWLKTKDNYIDDFEAFVYEQLPGTQIMKLSELEYAFL